MKERGSVIETEEENFTDFGGKEWYELAKAECCNFFTKEKQGYCTTLILPIKPFRLKCSACEIGKYIKLKKSEKLDRKRAGK